MNNRVSIATIDNPEFINLHPSDISPLMSACDIKVLYVGQNRNQSYIDKATATEMSKTLRGCPIVGWYIEDKKDFGDHGDQIIIDGNGAKFNKLTKPYGFIPTDAKVWFQFFEDTDEFGNTCLREYLVVNGYLWTSQFPEAQVALDNKDPQSMELDEATLKGHWATDNNTGLEFFIINDAIFSTLCILGEDVEPCFEGAQFLEPEINSTFSKEKGFVKDFVTMMKEIKYSLNNNEGGLSMNENKTSVVEEQVVESQTLEQPATQEEQIIENSLNEQGENSELNSVENVNTTEEFAKNSDNKEEEKEDPASEEKNDEDDKEEEDEKKPKSKNSLNESSLEIESLQKNFNELQEKFALLEKENAELIAFKNNIENEQKDELIASFYMLSDEDKKDVIANKANYSLDDIKKELSVICFDKKVNFNTEEQKQEDTLPSVTFNLDSHQADTIPAWLKSVEDVKNRNN